LAEEAIKCYAFVTRSDATDLDAWGALTSQVMKEGDFAKALDLLREAYVHHPEEARIKAKLAVCHLKTGDDEELAAGFLEEALASDASLVEGFTYYFPLKSCSKRIAALLKKYKE